MGADGGANVDFYRPQPVRPPPELDEQGETEADKGAYGSDEVLQAFEAWRDVVQNIIFTVGSIARERAADKGHQPTSGNAGGSLYLNTPQPPARRAGCA